MLLMKSCFFLFSRRKISGNDFLTMSFLPAYCLGLAFLVIKVPNPPPLDISKMQALLLHGLPQKLGL